MTNASTSEPLMPSQRAIERVAQFLHDEGGFDESWSNHTWPEHPDDTGQRDGGFVKIVPVDVQAKFRDVARRLLLGHPSAALKQAAPAMTREAVDLLKMLVAADDEAKPNGIMDCIDNDGHPYQSAGMAGLIVHARMLADPHPLVALTTIAKQETDSVREAVRREIINTPETADFMAAVPLEAVHQRERWGSSHDAGKDPQDWFWLIGYLAGKALRAASDGDADKAKHHTISTAAALANWHAALTGADTSMRPGIEPPAALSTDPTS